MAAGEMALDNGSNLYCERAEGYFCLNTSTNHHCQAEGLQRCLGDESIAPPLTKINFDVILGNSWSRSKQKEMNRERTEEMEDRKGK